MLKRSFLALFLLFFCKLISQGQDGYYFGLEGGFKWSHFVYTSDIGSYSNHFSYDPIGGCHLGYKHLNVALETGIHWHIFAIPFYSFNYENGSVSKFEYSGTSSPEIKHLVVPLRIGYDFLHRKHQWFLKPEMGFNMMFVLQHRFLSNPVSLGSRNVQTHNIPPSELPSENESTSSLGYVADRFNLGFESSISGGYRFRYKADIYLKISFLSSFDVLYYENIIHHLDSGDIEATRSFGGDSFCYQLGIRYYFGEVKQGKYWLRK